VDNKQINDRLCGCIKWILFWHGGVFDLGALLDLVQRLVFPQDVVLSSSLGTIGSRGSFRGVLRGSLRSPPIAIPGTVRTSLPRLRRGPLGRLKPGVAALAAVIGLISAAALMGAATAAGSAVGAAVPAFAIVACE